MTDVMWFPGWDLGTEKTIRKKENKNKAQILGKNNVSISVSGNVNWCSHYGKQYGGSSKN